MTTRTVWWEEGTVRLVDQTRLPHETVVAVCATAADVASAIRTLRVRGAPAIGVTAAYGLALAAYRAAEAGADALAAVEAASGLLRAARPTAVNLRWAVDRLLAVARGAPRGAALAERLLAEAEAIAAADVAANQAIGRLGAAMIGHGECILTYCHTGGLATAGYGTAFGILRAAHEAGRGIRVVACETRPVLQGARLTAWELLQHGIPGVLITDNVAGSLMARGEVDRVIVGADRIARNGDVANKIGTYALAVLARAHGIPFVVAAPTSTVDLATPDGAAIPIEERDAHEVTHLAGVRVAPEGIAVRNPAFDVTPHRLITAIVTEAGVAAPPYDRSLAALAGAAVGS
ncbi:MAG: S-methyl-5-thioribose-1-phosphate isomerase [Armatimonadota bacterium]|nr:S-methyl-5-thioribose-1-phosphate isomerase [Armatimonadota bacterium]MDR7453436.1 S-methyl-5-thioribose-1-phosphate isomerase [Armatimonadota bacterium]MDR7457346.1 S-methyl-5-thioribose-1-phosphate isomerase [Armatimonadota bacterium]MDR7495652.1 S-methyl-5-thioribose-1-phosphate isomerase [Armatimonadota bacterium]MDR7511592.1 S-methyl-5-thioribose-1-phosphate isomerase [Armatimonadota bacterium]